MKKLIATLTLAALACSTAVHAQATDSKNEWAAKVVALQQGPELNRLVNQLAGGSAEELIAKWAPQLQANVPKAAQAKTSETLNAELQKYGSDASALISKHVAKVSADALVPAYAERFTVDELKQIAAFFESPAIKKYQAASPELGSVFVQKLIEASRADVQARAREFDAVAEKLIGSKPAAATPPKAAPPAKK